ncbi:hypothetical protein E4H12_13640 [Candidatus Thorarchaeota archaeon]|nr:MAG: hypothetical protein E4H12_13640 [Candidatus Thorarchaeota archaeon]
MEENDIRFTVVAYKKETNTKKLKDFGNRMSSNRKKSPWAFEDAELQCPRCQSKRVNRILEHWATQRGIQMFKCTVCGNKFYDRNVDDYRPTYNR